MSTPTGTLDGSTGNTNETSTSTSTPALMILVNDTTDTSTPTESPPQRKQSRSQAARLKAKKHAERIRERAKQVSNRLTQSKAFQRLVDWAFRVCDTKKTNHITSEQLYSGLLLVHLNLARFCGSAACMPPSRTVVQELFDASDVDESGGIDREEFDIILKVSCAQIFGRMMINYATLILVIPFVSKLIVERYLDPESPYLEMICIQFTGMVLFVVIVPMLWKIVDRGAYKEAGRQASRQRSVRNLQLDHDHNLPHHHQKEGEAEENTTTSSSSTTTNKRSLLVSDKKTD